MTRLLGAALILGSGLVSIIIIWVLAVYYQDGQLSAGWLLPMGILLIGLITAPQLALGIYLWRQRQKPE